MVTEPQYFAGDNSLLQANASAGSAVRNSKHPVKQYSDVSRPINPQIRNSNHIVERMHSMPGDLKVSDVTTCVGPSKNKNAVTSEKATSSAQQWKVTKVLKTPVYYPLERTAVVVEPPTKLEDVTAKISRFLRKHSVSAVFYDEPGRVDCMTCNLLKFSIQLWEAIPSRQSMPSQQCPGIVIEVQRRSGCCIEMFQLRRELMRFLLTPNNRSDSNDDERCEGDGGREFGGDLTQNTEEYHHLFEEFQSVDESTRKNGGEKLQDQSTDAFLISLTLLQSSQLNQNRLGLESLCVLADPYSVSKIQAQHVASRVMMDRRIHALIQPYFAETQVSPVSLDRCIDNGLSHDSDDDEGTDRILDYEQGKLFGAMHILALKVVSRSLDTWIVMMTGGSVNVEDGDDNGECGSICGGIQFPSTLVDASSTFWNQVTKSCVYDIELSHHRPLEASLSVHSLRLLTRLIPKPRMDSLLYQDGRSLDQILIGARCYGHEHHQSLERETEIFMKQLGLKGH
jgi:hypothetical protein